ncbi:unnamed protein product [Prunus brigantina]
MAAMEKFSMEMRTLFREETPVTPTHTQASGYGPYSQPKSWGQSRPTQVDPGPTCPAKTARGPLHALAVSLGQGRPEHPAVQQTGPVRTIVVPIHHGLGNVTAVSPPRHGQNNPTVWLSQASVMTAEPPVQKTEQIEPQKKVQQVQRPLPTQPKPTPRHPQTEKIWRTSEDGSAQRWPGALDAIEPCPPEMPRVHFYVSLPRAQIWRTSCVKRLGPGYISMSLCPRPLH